MMKKGWSAIWRQKQYVIAGTLVIIAAIGATVFYGTREEEQREQMEAEIAEEILNQAQEEVAQESSEEAAVVSAVIPPKTVDTNIDEIERAADVDVAAENVESDLEDFNLMAEVTEGESEEVEDVTPAAEAAATNKTLHFSPEDGIMWPMQGDVILNYSMDGTIFFPTLNQYKYNPAVIIAGEVNSKVFSVAKGKVSSIVNDEVTGTTMTVDLGDGYEAIYGQLKELNFKEGDYVETGHVLGFISEPTKYYSVEGSNLYFELRKDGESINPIEFFE